MVCASGLVVAGREVHLQTAGGAGPSGSMGSG